MSLYAIGDLHLSYHPSVVKTQEIFGGNWINYQQKIDQEWRKCIKQDDTIVITGDLSWGKKHGGGIAGSGLCCSASWKKDITSGQP